MRPGWPRICPICKAQFDYDHNRAHDAKTCSPSCGRQLRSQSIIQDPIARFESFFTKSEGCWEWTGSKSGPKLDRGQFCYRGRNVKAPRFAYELYVGPITDGLYVCHECDNPGCVNPAHLFLGTCKDNAQDAKQKGRIKITHHKGEKHGGAKLSEADVLTIRERLSDRQRGAAKQLAEEYGVAKTHINAIARRATWKHI